jgi:glutamine synthetase
MAADWGFRDDPSLFKGSGPLELTEKLYVKGNIFADEELLKRLPVLPASCVESSRILIKKRALYEREGIFPPSVVDYMARLLAAENDEFMNEKLIGLPTDDRLLETRKIMHKDIHRH